MKSFIVSCLLLSVYAVPHDLGGQTESTLLDQLKEDDRNPLLAAFSDVFNIANSEPVLMTKLEPELRKEAKRKKIVWGPYHFPASESAPPDPNKEHKHDSKNATDGTRAKGSSLFNSLLMNVGFKMDPSSSLVFARAGGICGDCTVLRGSIYISDEEGRRLDMKDGAYLHHILLVNPFRFGTKNGFPFYSCETWNPLSKLKTEATFPLVLSAGVEQPNFFFTTPDGKFNSGHYIKSFEQIVLEVEAINYNKQGKDWHIAFDYEYVEGKPKGLQDVSAAFFNVAGCAGLDIREASFYGPPGAKRFSSTGPQFRVRRDGTIIHTVGHLHDGGDSIEMKLNGKSVCMSHAGYGPVAEGSQELLIQNMTECPRHIPVKTGDLITVTANYDVEKHPLRTTGTGKQVEAMGLFETLFAAKADD